MEIYITTDLLFFDGEYRLNAVYAFKSKTSVKSYEKYLKSTGEDHRLIVTPTNVTDIKENLQVITLFDVNDESSEYKSTRVMDDYDIASDYVANIKDSRTSVKAYHDLVKISSRFSPDMLHCGYAKLFFS